MGLFKKKAQNEPVDEFTLAPDIPGLQAQKRTMEAFLAKPDQDPFDKARVNTRLDYVNARIKVLAFRANLKKEPPGEPWTWPGPIPPAGMKAKSVGDGTYIHHTTTEEQTYNAKTFEKVRNWAEAVLNIDPDLTFSHWGAISGRTSGPLYTHENFIILQERLKDIAKEKSMGLFKTKAPPEPVPQEAIDKLKEQALEATEELEGIAKRLDQEAKPVDAAGDWKMAAAMERLEVGGVPEIDRLMADNILKDRNTALLEYALIEEQYHNAKGVLLQYVEDIDLVYSDGLAKYLDHNNPTNKKSWELAYGTLKRANKPFSASLDEEDDPGELKLQAWLKTTFEKDPELAKRLGIAPLTRYSRDMRAIQDYVKEQKQKTGKAPNIAGIKVKEAREDVFSIGPSIDTFKKKVSEELKEKGIK